MKVNKQIFKTYLNYIFTLYFAVTLFRLVEVILVYQNHGMNNSIILSEMKGWGVDILYINIFIVLYYPLYVLILKKNISVIKVLNLIFLYVVVFFSFLVTKYFSYQLVPLDIFLYNYSFEEILFTINTSDVSITNAFITMIVISIIISGFIWGVSRTQKNSALQQLTYYFILISVPVSVFSHFYLNLEKFSTNKPVYFASESLKYLFSTNSKYPVYNNVDGFQKLFPNKDFLSKEYPLLHKRNRDNHIGAYFEKFEQPPNVVVLIVEGLNNDYVHNYKGVQFMPFLDSLKGKSLYWNRCFTLGERSFAAVPSILGGLPYGEKGFTLLDKLPRHLSLVSTLNSNDYHTAFYYGQGAWFHKKDRFFEYNNIDLIFDKDKFSDKYEKIHGQNDFFWGYNDRDLFNQSLEVIDTLSSKRRLDIYFTGTSHSPFEINYKREYYKKKLTEFSTEKNTDFFDIYSKYLKTILFVDDALEEFFKKYKERGDYENTVFIITGDHPITELPIENSLKRYHVPLLIYSEKLKNQKTFSNTVSHLDIQETILSLLESQIDHVPEVSTSLGSNLFDKSSNNTKNVAFMNDNRQIIDFLSNDYFLSDDDLYEVDPQLNLKKVNDESLKLSMQDQLNAFKTTSLYTSMNNRIISNELYCKELNLLNIYSSRQYDSTKTSSEQFNLSNEIEIPNVPSTLDIGVNINANNNENISIVYQIRNSEDSTILWKNFGIADGEKTFQLHDDLDQLPVKDSLLYFKSYIWNKDKKDLLISNVDLLLYTN